MINISRRRKEINSFWQLSWLSWYRVDSGLWKSTVKLIENDDWSPCAKTSRVYILPRDKDPRLRDELKIRVGDSENFAHSLFYLASIKLQSTLLSFFSPSLHSQNSYHIKYERLAFNVLMCVFFFCASLISFWIYNYCTKSQKKLSARFLILLISM